MDHDEARWRKQESRSLVSSTRSVFVEFNYKDFLWNTCYVDVLLFLSDNVVRALIMTHWLQRTCESSTLIIIPMRARHMYMCSMCRMRCVRARHMYVCYICASACGMCIVLHVFVMRVCAAYVCICVVSVCVCSMCICIARVCVCARHMYVYVCPVSVCVACACFMRDICMCTVCVFPGE